jgi:hypothetical protein
MRKEAMDAKSTMLKSRSIKEQFSKHHEEHTHRNAQAWQDKTYPDYNKYKKAKKNTWTDADQAYEENLWES